MTSIKLKFRTSALQEKEGRNKTTVFNFIRQQISQLRVAGRRSTADHYAQTLSSLMRFREDRDLHFDDITPQFALAYETWLREQRLCRNSSSFYLRVVRTLYNKAVAAGLTPVWNVRMVSWVPGSPMDWAAMMPTASPGPTGLEVARFMP